MHSTLFKAWAALASVIAAPTAARESMAGGVTVVCRQGAKKISFDFPRPFGVNQEGGGCFLMPKADTSECRLTGQTLRFLAPPKHPVEEIADGARKFVCADFGDLLFWGQPSDQRGEFCILEIKPLYCRIA